MMALPSLSAAVSLAGILLFLAPEGVTGIASYGRARVPVAQKRLLIGDACWDRCGHTGGFCEACGRGHACCAALNPLNLPECNGVRVANPHEHQCAVPTAHLVDKAVYRTMESEHWGEDVSIKVNEFLTRNGLNNFTGGLGLNEAFGDPAPGRGKLLRVYKGRRFVDIKEKGKPSPAYDLAPFILTQITPLVDSAFLLVSKKRSKYVNVTDRVNELITVNGLRDITQNRSLTDAFGDPFQGEHKTLVLRRGGRKLEVHESSKQHPSSSYVYDVSTLLHTEVHAGDSGKGAEQTDAVSGEGSPSAENVTRGNNVLAAEARQGTGAHGTTEDKGDIAISNATVAMRQLQGQTLVLDSKASHVAFLFPGFQIDRAEYFSTDSDETMDVTQRVNELIASNGVRDFTCGFSFRRTFGVFARKEEKVLRISKDSRFFQLSEMTLRGDHVYDLSPLYGEAQVVDGAFYSTADVNGKFINVTTQLNQMIVSNGISDVTNGLDLPSIFGDPAPGESKMLRAVKGSRVLDLMENNGAYELKYDLMPLFLETGYILPKKSMPWPRHQPSVFVAVFSRRPAMSRRQVIRDMWMRAVGSTGNVTVKYVVCDASDEYQERLEFEDKVHGDMLFLECSEGYGQGLLTWKVLAAMTAYRSSIPEHDLFMKVDDDTFVAWHHFSSFLMNKGHRKAYIGIPIGQGQPCRNPAYRWYEPYETFNETLFPEAMAGGSGYILGRDLVEDILDKGIGRDNILWNEDRAVGVWVNRLSKIDVPVEYVAVPGIDGFWGWDWRRPSMNWRNWGEYPHLVHHGLEAETIACLAQADASDDPWQPISHCFSAEEGQERQQLTCTQS